MNIQITCKSNNQQIANQISTLLSEKFPKEIDSFSLEINDQVEKLQRSDINPPEVKKTSFPTTNKENFEAFIATEEVNRCKSFKLKVSNHLDISLEMNGNRFSLPIGNGWEKAFYLVLLKNPDGINVKDFADNQNQDLLIRFYLETKSWTYDGCLNQIELWKKQGEFSDHCSINLARIRRKLRKLFIYHPELLEQLSINDSPRTPKKIVFNRNRVDWEYKRIPLVEKK